MFWRLASCVDGGIQFMVKPKDDTPIMELRNLGPACEKQMGAVGSTLQVIFEI